MKFYIYRHIRLDSNTPFYVGKGKDRRAYSKQGRNSYWKNIVKSVGYRVEIIARNLTEDQSFVEEMKIIKLYKSLGFCESNFAIGSINGGPTGVKRSAETRKKMAESKMGEGNPMKRVEVKEKLRKTILSGPKEERVLRAKKASAVAAKLKSERIVNIKTGEIFNSIKEAAKTTKYSSSQLGRILKGWYANNTDLRKVG